MERAAEKERRTLSNLCELLLEEAVVRRKKSPGVSLETRVELLVAVDLILENAPPTVIQATAEYLTDRAGKYGESRKR